MAEQLTKAQQQAVYDRGGKLLVSAAAGSGKTKVLVERLMSYIADPASRVNIDDFLIITYTKAAAAELRGKIAKALTQRIAQEPSNAHLQRQFQRLYLAKISTVHAFCGDILREYAYLLDLPGDFRMIDEAEDTPLRQQVLDRILTEAYDSIADDPDLMAFVDTQGVGRNDQQVPELILKVYDSAKCHMDPDGWLDKCLADMNTDGTSDASETLWGKYLMQVLFDSVDLHLQALKNAANLCAGAEGLEKMSQVLLDIRNQLTAIRSAKSWDEIHRLRHLDGGDLKGIGNRKNVDKETYAACKVVRDACIKDMEDYLRDFANDSRQILADMKQILPAARGLISLVHRFDSRYKKVKNGLRVMDFSDLEHRTLDLLLGKSRSGPTAAARQIGARFCQIMVDEYQDSNEVQDAIFSTLAEGRDNLFMVGDVKQSIYQFRLADPGIFLDKYERFVSADDAFPGQDRKIVLSNNFRSGPEVIEAVNSVFRCCMSPAVGGLDYGDAEALWEGVPKEPLPDGHTQLHLIDVGSDTYAEEAEYVAQQIEQLLDGNHMVRGEDGLRPIQADDIVILLRSPKTSGWDFHYALCKRGIQTSSSHSVDLLSTEEVEWLRSLLQTVNNPRQDIPLISAITGPVFGFTADDLAVIRAQDRKGCFYEALRSSDLQKAAAFLKTLDTLRKMARMCSLPQLLEGIFGHTNADAVYSAMVDGTVRSRNLQEFYQYAVRYSSAPGADLSHFLNHLQQCEANGLMISEQGSPSGCVQITSIHKSKGLEYPVVFLCGLSRLFNMRSATGTLLCDSALGLGLSCVENSARIRYPSIANRAISRKLKADSISEELRVLYVAMTRPKDKLVMTFAQSKLDKKLFDYSVRTDLWPKELFTGRATCLGSWVLYTALQRTEAGQLFAVGRKTEKSAVSDIPWDIRYVQSQSAETDEMLAEDMVQEPVDPQVIADLELTLRFRYPHLAATIAPSKLTATQIKGRYKDQEISEDAPATAPTARKWREPELHGGREAGSERGNAFHAVMQHIDFSACTDEDSVGEQIDKLVDSGYLTAGQAALVSAKKIVTFFCSPFGTKLRCADNVLREFKFSILENAEGFAPGLQGEEVLLQGVVDCALVEPDGITVIDFKTDRITKDSVTVSAEHYRPQVETYARALSRIYELPVKAKALYYFSLDSFVWL